MSFQIRKAKQFIIPNFALVGKSSSGKTYSALLLAWGYVGRNNKVVVIDTENRRSEAYANDPDVGGFDILELNPDYTPERFIEALNQAYAYVGENGAVIIDSASNEWEGIGGILEIADKNSGNALLKWAKPKMRHQKFVHCLANPKAMTVVCFRIKDKIKEIPEKDSKKPIVYEEEIVTEKNFHYDLTTIIKLEPETHKAFIQKLPKPLHKVIKNGDVITLEAGRLFADRIKIGNGSVFNERKWESEALGKEVDIGLIYEMIQKSSNVEEIRNIYKEFSKHSQIEDIKTFCMAETQRLKEIEALEGG